MRIIKKQCTCGHETLEDMKDLLVHLKDKQDKEDITECVHKVPCANCDKIHVGETGRKLGERLHEHKTEVESKTKRAFTRSQRTASLMEYSKSALDDHANHANHTIDRKRTTVIDREQDGPTRWIKEAVHIRKEGHRAKNRDEGSYQLSHAYDRLLDATADCCIKTQKN